MSDDELIEVPGEQLFQRSTCEISLGERQPDFEPNAALRSGNALQLEERIAQGFAPHARMDLDEIVQDERARRSMQEQDFLDEPAALEGQLVEVIGPGGRWRVFEGACEGQVPLL